eukprot:5509513-Prorocentrum_lima.AAC.2
MAWSERPVHLTVGVAAAAAAWGTATRSRHLSAGAALSAARRCLLPWRVGPSVSRGQQERARRIVAVCSVMRSSSRVRGWAKSMLKSPAIQSGAGPGRASSSFRRVSARSSGGM